MVRSPTWQVAMIQVKCVHFQKSNLVFEPLLENVRIKKCASHGHGGTKFLGFPNELRCLSRKGLSADGKRDLFSPHVSCCVHMFVFFFTKRAMSLAWKTSTFIHGPCPLDSFGPSETSKKWVPYSYLSSLNKNHLTIVKYGFVWKCCVPHLPNGFADHYPYEKWLFHWGYTPFSDIPISLPWTCGEKSLENHHMACFGAPATSKVLENPHHGNRSCLLSNETFMAMENPSLLPYRWLEKYMMEVYNMENPSIIMGK